MHVYNKAGFFSLNIMLHGVIFIGESYIQMTSSARRVEQVAGFSHETNC